MRLRATTYQAPEPNLTPLLDLVLQLIMFFMVCVSLLGREPEFDLRLPAMQHACPPESARDQLVLNVDRAGRLHVSDRGAPGVSASRHRLLLNDTDILAALNGWASAG